MIRRLIGRRMAAARANAMEFRTATEADVLLRPKGEKRLFELVDGVLVEKALGIYEARLALILG